jgi:hypothetical protein
VVPPRARDLGGQQIRVLLAEDLRARQGVEGLEAAVDHEVAALAVLDVDDGGRVVDEVLQVLPGGGDLDAGDLVGLALLRQMLVHPGVVERHRRLGREELDGAQQRALEGMSDPGVLQVEQPVLHAPVDQR